jgi:hypothetical protein
MPDEKVSTGKKASRSVQEHIEDLLKTVITGLGEQPEPEKAGRPRSGPSSSLWRAILVAVLRGVKSQRGIWRLLATGGCWGLPCSDIGDQGVDKRLEQEGWRPLARVCERISQRVAQWVQPALQSSQAQHGMLAPFASEVIALDETILDRVSRRLPILRHWKKGDGEVFPGTLVRVCDVRLHQWRTIEDLSRASENGRERARQVLTTVKKGALILADLGSVACRWFDEMTEQGNRWISRGKEGTTVVVLHTSCEAGDTGDRLVWLGAEDRKANYAVRQVPFRQAGVVRHSLTTVCNPVILPLSEIARRSARRWESEVAFLTLKRELGVHLMWSSNALVVQAHVWAALGRAHVMQAIRMDVALRAEVDAFEVSLPLLFETMPTWQWHGRDGSEEWVRQGRRLGLIRPSTRLRVQAPQIPPEHLIPLPQGTLLCRHPFYGKPKDPMPQSDQPALPPDPARDRVVALLCEREAERLALTRLARTASALVSTPASLQNAGKQTRSRTPAKPPKPFVPDPRLTAPSLVFPQPFLGLA